MLHYDHNQIEVLVIHIQIALLVPEIITITKT